MRARDVWVAVGDKKRMFSNLDFVGSFRWFHTIQIQLMALLNAQGCNGVGGYVVGKSHARSVGRFVYKKNSARRRAAGVNSTAPAELNPCYIQVEAFYPGGLPSPPKSIK